MIPIKVPPLGESIVEATVSRWLKREGDQVAAGETLVELETDKVTVEIPATTAGTLVRRLHQEGDVVRVDAILGEIDTAAPRPAPSPAPVEPAPQLETAPGTPPKPPSPLAPPPAAPPPAAPPDLAPPPTATASAGELRASPAASRLAAEAGVNLAEVTGTGRGSVVSKPDVVEHIERRPRAEPAVSVSPAPTVPLIADAGPVAAEPPSASRAAAPAAGPAPAAQPPSHPVPREPRETREKMSTRRKRIAEHLLEAQHATAHLTTFNEIDMSVVEALRSRVRDRIEKEHGVRLSFMPFFVRAACIALRQYPVVNARVDGDSIVYHNYVNMGIAVSSDAGLVVPNIKDADSKGVIQVGRDIVGLAQKAREGRLVMDDLTGGTFTITNGGVFGSLLSTPIINFPQAGILGLHKTQDRPVAIEGRVEIRPMMYVALSYDHRIIDGQQAVLFLVRLKELMEDPALMAID